MARGQLAGDDRRRYIIILTDGYPDAAESAVEQAGAARQAGIEIVAIGTGDADRDYLRRLASSEQASIFARSGELVQTFGHIARVIAEGGRRLRVYVMSGYGHGELRTGPRSRPPGSEPAGPTSARRMTWH